MKCTNIFTTNLDILQSIDSNYLKATVLPCNISHILSKVVIYYELDHVNCFEMMGLDQIGRIADIEPYGGYGMVIDEFMDYAVPKESTLNISPSGEMIVRKAMSTNGVMIYAEDNVVRGELKKFLKLGPVGYQTYSCTCILTGASILNLFGYEFTQIFEPVDGTPLEKSVESKLITGLISATYKHLQNILTTKDIYTDAWMHKNNYAIKEDAFAISSVYDNLGNSLVFVDSTEAKLEEMIESAKKMNGLCKKREWTIEVICHTTIAEYFYYLFAMPTYNNDRLFQIVDTEDLMMLLTRDSQMNYNSEKFGETIKINNLAYNEWFNSKMDSGEFDLYQRFLFAPASSRIRYTMHIKYSSDRMADIQIYLKSCYSANAGWYVSNARILSSLLNVIPAIIEGYELDK